MLCCYAKDGIVFDRLLLQLELIFFAADFNVFSKAYSVKRDSISCHLREISY